MSEGTECKSFALMMIFEQFLEADECYRKDETTVFINVTRSDSKHFVNVFWRHNRRQRRYQLGARRCRRWCRRLLLVKPPGEPSNRMSIVVLGQRVLSASSFTHPIGVVNLEISDLSEGGDFSYQHITVSLTKTLYSCAEN